MIIWKTIRLEIIFWEKKDMMIKMKGLPSESREDTHF